MGSRLWKSVPGESISALAAFGKKRVFSSFLLHVSILVIFSHKVKGKKLTSALVSLWIPFTKPREFSRSNMLQLSGSICFTDREQDNYSRDGGSSRELIEWHKPWQPQQESCSPGFRERRKPVRSLRGKFISISNSKMLKDEHIRGSKNIRQRPEKGSFCHHKGPAHRSLVPHFQLRSAPMCQRKAVKQTLYHSRPRNEAFLAMTGEPSQ